MIIQSNMCNMYVLYLGYNDKTEPFLLFVTELSDLVNHNLTSLASEAAKGCILTGGGPFFGSVKGFSLICSDSDW